MAQRKAAVVGSGPNGLAAAIVLAQAGLDVEVREAAPTVGGALRSGELTEPGIIHDIGAAVHPMGFSSPFFRSLPLEQFGLRWIFSDVEMAHPFDDGSAALLTRNLDGTAAELGRDAAAYRELYKPLVENWPQLYRDVFKPIGWPQNARLLAAFGSRGLQPATRLAGKLFAEEKTRGLFAGSAAHSVLPLEQRLTASFGLLFGAAAHAAGWPIAEGGSQRIADALAAYFVSLGGRLVTDARVEKLEDLGSPDLTLCDIAPRQWLALAGHRVRESFRSLLFHYRHGPGSYKVDWALREPIPWKAEGCKRAITVHVGGTMGEIAESERAVWKGQVSERPFVLLVQPTLFDKSRAPEGRHTAWAYCHVPNGWRGSALHAIEAQIERFAPGFGEIVVQRATHDTAQLERWDENLIGGDVGGGAIDMEQMLFRPTWRRYGTPLRGVYLCSASTPPGGGVHGMCGYWAAHAALEYLHKRLH